VHTILQTRRHVSSKLWNLGKLNHIAIAVPDLGNVMMLFCAGVVRICCAEKASVLYRDVFGATVSEAVVSQVVVVVVGG